MYELPDSLEVCYCAISAKRTDWDKKYWEQPCGEGLGDSHGWKAGTKSVHLQSRGTAASWAVPEAVGAAGPRRWLCPSALPLCDLTCSAVSRPGVFSTRAGPEEGYENDWGLEYLSYKDGRRELELFSMEKRRVCVILIVVLQYHKWGYKKDISFYMDR